VIVDINMPLMDGVTFLSALRRQALPLSSIPTLVTSTESKAADIEAARAAGANFYSAKPVGREDLARTMAMFCGVPQ
jgi:two-component system, chemotaxis family, chemotaxis protein CheY